VLTGNIGIAVKIQEGKDCPAIDGVHAFLEPGGQHCPRHRDKQWTNRQKLLPKAHTVGKETYSK
jgi:hypothetical protein